MPKEVYVLTQDGWTEGYGSEIYLIGVYLDKELAERYVSEHFNVTLTIIEPNKAFPLRYGQQGRNMENDYHLGGYIE